MITPELANYVRQQIALGVAPQAIAQNLIAQGWSQQDVSDVLQQGSPAASMPVPSPSSAPAVAMDSSASVGLQQQYPLSPKKFWKKIIGRILPTIFLSAAIGVGIYALSMVFFVSSLSSYTPGNTSANDAAVNSSLAHAMTISITAALASLIIILVLYAWYVSAYIRRYYYDANNSFVTIKKGVFAPAEIHVQYSKIQDVYVDQDILDRIMGLYDVHLASATMASGIEAHIDGVDAAGAAGLKEFLLSKLRTGGGATMPGTMGSASAAGGMPAGPAVKFSGDVSSVSYPIVGAWLVQQAVVWIFTSAFYSVLIVIYIFAKSTSAPSMDTVVTLGIVIFVVTYIFHIVYSVLWRSTFSFAFLPDYVVTKTGIIAKNETHLPYRSVQDVTVSQGIIERLFGLATVRIENAAQMVNQKGQRISSAIKLPGQPFAKANEISDALKQVALSHSSAGTGL